jgi:hypothetical protein
MAEKRTIELEVKESGFKSLKAQLREAQADVAALSDKFGATSDQAIAAAKAAAILKDTIGDAKTLTDAFDPDAKFKALGGSLSGVANGFQAVQGAMGLIGVDSKAVEESLLKVQSAMAFAQGIDGVLASVDSFKTLAKMLGIVKTAKTVDTVVTATQATVTTAASVATGKMTIAQRILNLVMKANPIFLIIGGIAALITAYALFSSSTETAKEKQQKLNEAQEEATKIMEAHNKKIDERKALEKELSAVITGGIVDQENQIKLMQAYGADAIAIQEAKQKILLDKLTEFQNEEFNSGRIFNAKEKAANIKNINDTQTEIQVLASQFSKEQRDEEEKRNTAAAEKRKEKRKAELEQLTQFIKDATKANLDGAKSDQQVELDNIELKYKEQIALAKKYGKDTTQLIEAQKNEQNLVNTKYAQIEVDIENAKLEQLANLKAEAKRNAKLQEDEYLLTIENLAEENYLNTLSLQDREIQSVNDKYFVLEEAAKGNAEQEKIIAEAKANELIAINNKTEVEIRNKKLQLAASAFDALGTLAGSFNAKNESDARKQFKIQKAFNMASAITNTALAVSSALALLPGQVVFPGQRFVEAGIAGVSGLAAVANIAKTQFNSGGGSMDSPTAPSGGGGVSAPNFNIVGNSGINQLAELGGQPIQAYVVSGEVTSAQALDRNRIQNASF